MAQTEVSWQLRLKKLATLKGADSVIHGHELFAFLKEKEPKLTEGAYRKRIWTLVNEGVLVNVARDQYILSERKHFHPILSPDLKKLHSRLQKSFPLAQICIWSSSVLNEFFEFIPASRWDFVEAETEVAKSIFQVLRSFAFVRQPLYNPKEKEIDMYLTGSQHALVVRPLLSQAPLLKVDGIPFPRIEKILVDVSVDSVFQTYEGTTLRTLWTNVFESYVINFSVLARYAQRRNKLKFILDMMSKTKLPKYASDWLMEKNYDR